MNVLFVYMKNNRAANFDGNCGIEELCVALRAFWEAEGVPLKPLINAQRSAHQAKICAAEFARGIEKGLREAGPSWFAEAKN
jgi:hypothetical protein